MAIKSSSRFGSRSLRYLFIPVDSNWNIPVVSPLLNNSKVLLSSSGIVSILISIPFDFFMLSMASLIIDSVLRPRKSILRRPTDSTWLPSYCVA